MPITAIYMPIQKPSSIRNYSTNTYKMTADSKKRRQSAAQKSGKSLEVVAEPATFRLNLASILIAAFLFIRDFDWRR